MLKVLVLKILVLKIIPSLTDNLPLSISDDPCRPSKYIRPDLLVVFGPACKTPADAEELLYRKFIRLWQTTPDPFRETFSP